jgi:predicted helicase
MGSTDEALLEQLATTATAERDKGDKFERLVCRFRAVESQRGSGFSQVCRWIRSWEPCGVSVPRRCIE